MAAGKTWTPRSQTPLPSLKIILPVKMDIKCMTLCCFMQQSTWSFYIYRAKLHWRNDNLRGDHGTAGRLSRPRSGYSFLKLANTWLVPGGYKRFFCDIWLAEWLSLSWTWTNPQDSLLASRYRYRSDGSHFSRDRFESMRRFPKILAIF